MRKALLLALPILAAGLISPAMAATTVTVNETNLGVDWHTADTRTGGTMSFQTVGGASAVQMVTDSTNAAKVQLFTSNHDGMTLDEITSLSYTSWRDSSSTGFDAGSAAINLVVDRNSDGVGDTYLVFEPYRQQPAGNSGVLTDTWQTWTAIDATSEAGGGTWFVNTGVDSCKQGQAFCSWNDVKALLGGDTKLAAQTTSAGVPTGFKGSLGLNVGSWNPGYVVAVDTLEVNGTTYDFAPRVFSKADCKDGGWKANFAPGKFINQGDCVSFFASDGKTHK